jgi:hypothetical protein
MKENLGKQANDILSIHSSLILRPGGSRCNNNECEAIFTMMKCIVLLNIQDSDMSNVTANQYSYIISCRLSVALIRKRVLIEGDRAGKNVTLSTYVMAI